MDFAVAEAFVVFDMRQKTFAPHSDLAWVLAHQLQNFSETDRFIACERVWTYSNFEGRLCGYDGPSLSMGDMVRLTEPDGTVSLFRAAVVGFVDISAERDRVERARVHEPTKGRYRVPVCDLTTGRITRGDTWKVWLL